MKNYKQYKLVPEAEGFMELSSLDKDFGFQKAWAVLNIYGSLATSTDAPTALFLDKGKAEKHISYLKKEVGVVNVYKQEVMLRGDEVRIPIGYDLELPEDKKAREVAIIILEEAVKTMGVTPYSGGCRTFYTTDEWKERKEEYGLDSELIICHDGGDFKALCSYDAGDYGLLETFDKCLEKKGYYVEQCTCWYSAVYKTEEIK